MKITINFETKKDKSPKQTESKPPKEEKNIDPAVAFQKKIKLQCILLRIAAVFCAGLAFLIWPIISAICFMANVAIGGLLTFILVGASFFLCRIIWKKFNLLIFQKKHELPPEIPEGTLFFRTNNKAYDVNKMIQWQYAYLKSYRTDIPALDKKIAKNREAEGQRDYFDDMELAIYLLIKHTADRSLSQEECITEFHKYHQELGSESPVASLYPATNPEDAENEPSTTETTI